MALDKCPVCLSQAGLGSVGWGFRANCQVCGRFDVEENAWGEPQPLVYVRDVLDTGSGSHAFYSAAKLFIAATQRTLSPRAFVPAIGGRQAHVEGR